MDEEKLTNERAVAILNEAKENRASARRAYESACENYVDVIRAVLVRIKEERGMTYRQMEGLVPRTGGNHYTFQYLNQVVGGVAPSDAMVEALIAGLKGEDGT